MSKISVVISAYNEEKKIGDCLQSIKWVDEIILIDNSSTDKTAEIAKKYGAKIYTQVNNPMLNVNKNFGFTKTNNKWILCLDADERVEIELAKEIQTLINEKTSVDGYWIPRKNIIFGKWMKHTGWYPDFQLRLFKKGKGKFPEKHVHEMIKVDGRNEYLKGHLIHYNFDNISQFLHKHFDIYALNEKENLLKENYKFNYLDAIRFPSQEFMSRFFAREGYKDGFHGLMLSIFLAFYHFVIFALIWEKQGFEQLKDKNILENIEQELKENQKQMKYWFLNEKITSSQNFLRKSLLRVRRKLL